MGPGASDNCERWTATSTGGLTLPGSRMGLSALDTDIGAARSQMPVNGSVRR